MADQNPLYNQIGSKYDDYSRTATAKRAERYSFLRMVGSLDGQRVLDLACGLGYYTRLIKQQGAGQVIGVDISDEMIRVANRHEEAEPLGITYRVCNALKFPESDPFDLITAIWLLNFAKTKEKLLGMFRMVYANLDRDGRFLAYTTNPAFDLRKSNFTKYGVRITKETLVDDRYTLQGVYVVIPSILVTAYRWRYSTYEWAIKTAGFREFAWYPSEVSPEDIEHYGQAYWQDFYDNCLGIGLICKK